MLKATSFHLKASYNIGVAFALSYWKVGKPRVEVFNVVSTVNQTPSIYNSSVLDLNIVHGDLVLMLDKGGRVVVGQ